MASPAASSSAEQAPQTRQQDVPPAERFFRYFQKEVTALQDQMSRLADLPAAGGERNDGVDHCLAGIARLSHEVKDASGYVPAHDQRTYAEAIKALSDKLAGIRAGFAPRPKFAFKSSQVRKNASAISLSDAAELANQQRLALLAAGASAASSTSSSSSTAATPAKPLSPTDENARPGGLSASGTRHADGAGDDDDNEDDEDEDEDGLSLPSRPRHPSFSNSTSITIAHHKNQHIILPASASHATSSGTLSHLRRCIIDLSPPTTTTALQTSTSSSDQPATPSPAPAPPHPFASLTLSHIRRSLLLCGAVRGPVHVTDVRHAVLVLGRCGQVRLHGCRDLALYLACASPPILEDCDGVRVAPVPAACRVGAPQAEAEAAAETAAETAADADAKQMRKEEPDCWDQVQDFNWLKVGEPSPHWRIMAEAERVPDSVWRDLVPGKLGVGIKDILEGVGISVSGGGKGKGREKGDGKKE